jgi:hypothetical protein
MAHAWMLTHQSTRFTSAHAPECSRRGDLLHLHAHQPRADACGPWTPGALPCIQLLCSTGCHRRPIHV